MAAINAPNKEAWQLKDDWPPTSQGPNMIVPEPGTGSMDNSTTLARANDSLFDSVDSVDSSPMITTPNSLIGDTAVPNMTPVFIYDLDD